MLDARAAALITSDVAFFSLPPLRPSRPARKRNRGDGLARSLIRAIGRELNRATEGTGAVVLPRIANYPY
jgi:hypothetical protein